MRRFPRPDKSVPVAEADGRIMAQAWFDFFGYLAQSWLATTTNDDAPAGSIGEFISSNVAIGAPVSVANNSATNITSVALTPGDWDVFANIGSVIGGATTIGLTESYITPVSATRAAAPNAGGYNFDQQVKAVGSNVFYTVGQRRFSLAAPATIYLGAYSLFSGGTNAYYGFIGARRAR